MKSVEQLALPLLRDVVAGELDRYDLTFPAIAIAIDVGDGHPSGAGRHYAIRSLVLEDQLVVQCALDVTWRAKVHQPLAGVVDDQFVLDVDGGLVAYIAWEYTDGLHRPYVRSTTRYAKLTSDGHLGARALGPDPWRDMRFLVQMDTAEVIAGATKDTSAISKEGT